MIESMKMKVDHMPKKIWKPARKQKRVGRTAIKKKLIIMSAASCFSVSENNEATGNNIKSINGYGKTLIPLF